MERESFYSNWDRVQVLGKGSYGVVYLAVPVSGPLNFVALKESMLEYSFSLMMERDILQNFIGCPEIVQYIGSEVCSSVNNVSYHLVLEYAEGGSLADLIKQRVKLPESEVKEYLRMILRGLSSIHSQGFVHCDLKPNNILVFPQNDGNIQLKIADFGLSMRCDECEEVVVYSNVKPKFRGTPIYMSPESVFFGKINTSLDIWSLGCILIEMVSGKPVWSDCTNREQVMNKLIRDMEIPDIPEELSREGKDFLARCLDQICERRWTAQMLLQHPYLEEDQPNFDELASLIRNFPVELFEERDFHESYFYEKLPEDLDLIRQETVPRKNDEMPLVLKQDDEIFKIAGLIGFDDFVL